MWRNRLKDSVRLTFPNGPEIKDPKKLFDARSYSRAVRTIDFFENDKINEAALRALVLEAVKLNRQK